MGGGENDYLIDLAQLSEESETKRPYLVDSPGLVEVNQSFVKIKD